MDAQAQFWYLLDMMADADPIQTYALYGERQRFPDIVHVEQVKDRAEGLNWTIAPHRHLELHQILVIHEGEGQVTLDGQPTRIVPPILVNLPPGTVHSFRFSTRTAGLVITLPRPEWLDLFSAADGLGSAFCMDAVDAITAAAEHLERACHDRSPLRPLRLRAAVSQLFLSILERPRPGQTKGRSGDPRVQRLFELIETQPNIGLSVVDCAQKLGLSQRHLSRLCLAETGLPLQALQHAAILREACRLLAYTRLNVATVGHRLGFDDPSYFSRFFLRETGVSPQVYRAKFDG